jgi:hypothetical protein
MEQPREEDEEDNDEENEKEEIWWEEKDFRESGECLKKPRKFFCDQKGWL